MVAISRRNIGEPWQHVTIVAALPSHARYHAPRWPGDDMAGSKRQQHVAMVAASAACWRAASGEISGSVIIGSGGGGINNESSNGMAALFLA